MIARLPPTVVSFFAVLCGYTIYVFIAVPWIEPHVDIVLPSRSADTPIRAPEATLHGLLSSCFPAGHWALNNPKVLDSPQGMLVWRDWQAHDNGQVDLVPCALLFFSEPRGDDGALARAPIILEAPQGARLQFDSSFDLSRGKFGNLLHGKLAGPITIRSDMDDPGPRDDLSLTTRDVQLTKSRIWTDAEVDFRLGAHHGHGRQLEIRLLPAPAGKSHPAGGIDVGGVQSLELKEEVHVELHPDDRVAATFMQGDQRPAPAAAVTTNPSEGTETTAQPPVRVTCKGPFHFDLARRTATFEDQVDVHRLRLNAASDTLSCRLLTLKFTNPPDSDVRDDVAEPAAAAAPDDTKRPAFQLRKIVAEGTPVKINSPATGGLVRCLELEYVPSDSPGELPEMTANGPGHLEGVVDDDRTRTFRAAWSERMALRKHEGQPVISIWGNATVAMAGAGTLSGDQMHIYLKEGPSSAARPGRPNVFPDRMVVTSEVEGTRTVRIASQPLTGAVDKLEVWFVRGALANARAADPTGPALTPAAGAGAPKPKQPKIPDKVAYDIRGRLLQVEMSIGDRTDVANLTVSEAVHFRETKTEKPGDIPLEVAGSWLRVAKADTPATEVTVRGQPASIAARGLTLQGDEIKLHRGDNRLWVESPGQMSLPVNRSMVDSLGEQRQQRAPTIPPTADRASSGPLHVSWQGQMEFDGQRASFNRSVMAWDEAGWLKTESLIVRLSQAVRFDQSRDTTGIDVAQMDCQGGVRLQNQTFDNAELTALDEIVAQDLSIDRATGVIHANGPGTVASIRMGSATPIAASAVAGPQAIAPTDSSELQYLQVNFGRTAEGNLHQRSLTFFGDIRAVHGPVDRWDARLDPTSIDSPGADDVRLTSHSLTVTQTDLGDRPQGTLEIEARGNALVERQVFTARAERIGFIQAKDQILLEGTGRTDARLWQQKQIGSAPAELAARKIVYWHRTGQVILDGYKTLSLSQTPQPKADERPAAARFQAVPR